MVSTQHSAGGQQWLWRGRASHEYHIKCVLSVTRACITVNFVSFQYNYSSFSLIEANIPEFSLSFSRLFKTPENTQFSLLVDTL